MTILLLIYNNYTAYIFCLIFIVEFIMSNVTPWKVLFVVNKAGQVHVKLYLIFLAKYIKC